MDKCKYCGNYHGSYNYDNALMSMTGTGNDYWNSYNYDNALMSMTGTGNDYWKYTKSKSYSRCQMNKIYEKFAIEMTGNDPLFGKKKKYNTSHIQFHDFNQTSYNGSQIGGMMFGKKKKYKTSYVQLSLSFTLNNSEHKLYIRAELFEYLKIMGSEGKLDFWDLYFLEGIHDIKLLEPKDKDNAEPSDKIIMEITI